MESFFDSLDILSSTVGSTSKASNDESFERLISQLTDKTSKTTPTQENGIKLEDPQNFDEILATDESLITPNCHNVSVLNVACQNVLKQMEHQLMTLLKRNRKEQEVIQNFLNANCKNSVLETPKKPSLKCIGMPYFKDSHGFQPPPNEDVLRKEKNKKFLPTDFLKGFPIWRDSDAKKLVQAVKEYDVLKPLSIDWMKISATNMEGKYSPSECKAKWTLHLNPSINKSKWTSKEMTLLKELGAKYEYQDWDKIGEELNTNRNGLQCCIQYHTHTAPTEGKWTDQEDEALKKLVEKFKVKDYIPWQKVAWHFEKRSHKQCQERYMYHLTKMKKGCFTMEEDFAIVYLASKLKNFGEVAKFIPDRVPTQVRSRYEYLVELSMPKFTKEEDELLLKLMIKYPRNWGKISESFKNRSKVQCRRRWMHLQKKIQLDVDIDNENDEFGNSETEIGRKKHEKSKIDEDNVRTKIPFISKPEETVKWYPEVYKKLLEYHKNCHKFLFGPKIRLPSSTEDLKSITDTMITTMKTLSVNISVNGFNMDGLSNNPEFDKEDFVVLESLRTVEQNSEGFELSSKIIPPNYISLVGLRTLTLYWNKIKELSASHTGRSPTTSEVDPNERILFSDAKKLFKSRLKTLFAFPLIMSNVTLPKNEKPVYKPKQRKTVKPLSKRKRKEHAKFMSDAYKNKLAGGSPQNSNVTQESKNNPQVSERSDATKESTVSRKRTRSKNEFATPLKKRVTRSSLKQEPCE